LLQICGEIVMPFATQLSVPASLPDPDLLVPVPMSLGLVSKYVFENPWPVTGLCLAIGLILGWKALREGHRPTLQVAIAVAILGAIVAGLGLSITTSAERGRAVVSALVSRAESGDVSGMLALLTPECLLHYGRAENPGLPRPDWEQSIGLLQGRYRIESNSITRLEAQSAKGNGATVELSCLTTVSSAPYPTPSAWWMRVAEQPDGSWKIERIAFLRVGRQEPRPGIL
jgi:hypothetical protein